MRRLLQSLAVSLSLVALLCTFTGCKEKEQAPTNATPDAAAPPAAPVEPSKPVEPAKPITFEITKVYDGQMPTQTAPWHTSGGDWKFFDAKTAGGSTIIVGIPSTMQSLGKVLGVSRDMLAVPDRAAGAHFVEEVAQAFHVPAPAAGPEKPLHAIEVTTDIRARNAMRTDGGDFAGVGGGWTAMRWTFDSEDGPALYFNYNLAEKRGEIVEKDPDDRSALVAALARSLRNGTDESK